MSWRRSEITATGQLGRALRLNGDRYAVLGPLGCGWAVYPDDRDPCSSSDVAILMAAHDLPMPTEADLLWCRGVA